MSHTLHEEVLKEVLQQNKNRIQETDTVGREARWEPEQLEAAEKPEQKVRGSSRSDTLFSWVRVL